MIDFWNSLFHISDQIRRLILTKRQQIGRIEEMLEKIDYYKIDWIL